MIARDFKVALSYDLPILFAYIGWTNEYKGTEPVQGQHGYLKMHPGSVDTSEARAFVKDDDDFFRCGIGKGKAPPLFHAVFLAVDPASGAKKVVGLYARASFEFDPDWTFARTKHAFLIPADRRPTFEERWDGQGVRRWAVHPTAHSYPQLLEFFKKLKSRLPAILKRKSPRTFTFDQTYSDITAQEGMPVRQIVLHRRREAKLRKRKIESVMSDNAGRLVCEVDGCGFDFFKKYGELGYGYAHVHHLAPLADTGDRGRKVSLQDLAIVCANCHAMIHNHGVCRDMGSLIPKVSKRKRS